MRKKDITPHIGSGDIHAFRGDIYTQMEKYQLYSPSTLIENQHSSLFCLEEFWQIPFAQELP